MFWNWFLGYLKLPFQRFQFGNIFRFRLPRHVCQTVLPEQPVLLAGKRFHLFVAARAFAFQYGEAVIGDDAVYAALPKRKRQALPVFGAQFRTFQKDNGQAVERVDFVGG